MEVPDEKQSKGFRNGEVGAENRHSPARMGCRGSPHHPQLHQRGRTGGFASWARQRGGGGKSSGFSERSLHRPPHLRAGGCHSAKGARKSGGNAGETLAPPRLEGIGFDGFSTHLPGFGTGDVWHTMQLSMPCFCQQRRSLRSRVGRLAASEAAPAAAKTGTACEVMTT